MKQQKWTVWTVVSINFLFLLNQFLLITAFPTIMQEFQVNATEVQWLTTAFLLTAAIMIPINGYFVDRFTLRFLVLVSLACFLVGTVAGILAPSFLLLVVARIIQAIGAGIMLPLAQTVLLLVYSSEKRGQAMGILGLVMNVAPAIGPAMSGLIIDLWDWRILFWMILLPLVGLIVITYLFIQNITETKAAQFDVFSFILSSIGFVAFLLGVSMINMYSFEDLRVIGTIGLGAGAFVWFGYRQLRLSIPLLNIKVFAYGPFLFATLSIFLISLLLLSAETLIPLFAQSVQGLSAFTSGMILMPGTFLLALFSWISGLLYDRYGRKVIGVGFVPLLISVVMFSLFQPTTSFLTVTVAFMFFMLGISITMMPQVAFAMNHLPASIMPHGTAVINALRQFAMAIGVTALTTIVTVSSQGQDHLYEGTRNAFLTMAVLGVISLAFFVVSNKGNNKRGTSKNRQSHDV
ncbi:DHA2 family efflux MFS transporter permease subunit [Marinococcus halophilus]|uniref:DHA2 family efflux MFS transporter permease subunit n=1 Tax=Marinococcus halophilus TaxID=1371 RepID=UPI001302F494|nr:DHA2 family efflux MFS transporter permease subunit [Marinococcus halophilus]